MPNVTGTSCFVNAVLQALASVPSFREWLEEKGNEFDREGVGRSMAKVMQYLDEEGDEEEEVTATVLLDALR